MGKVLCTTCTMETTSWLLVIICMVLVHSTDLSQCAPSEINSPSNDHVTGNYPTATISPSTMAMAMTMTTTKKMKTTMPMPMPMTSASASASASSSASAKSWSSQKPSRSKHITKSTLYKKTTKDKGGRAKVPFLSPTLVPTGYDVKKDISHHKEVEAPRATTTKAVATTIDTVVDNVNGPKDYTNKKHTNTSTLPHFDSLSLLGVRDEVESILSTNANGDEDSGKDIDFISDSRTTKADETYATTEGYHAKAGVAAAGVVVAAAAAALSTTTMPTSRVENPVSNMETIPLGHVEEAEKSIASSVVVAVAASVTYTPSVQSKSMPVNASLSFSSPLTTMLPPSSSPPKLPDVGHDGVKVTKKKQLFDKHFIAASSPSPSALPTPSPSLLPSPSGSGSLHASMRKDNPWSSLMSMNKPTKSNFAGSSGKKLMEVPNGYLGPIMMKEKTFSVSHHHGKKPKPSLVEQKLKDKKLVEIIAPTALMEPTSKTKNSQPDFVAIDMTTTVLMPTTTTTTTTAAATTTTTTAATTIEGLGTSTEVPAPAAGKGKKKEIESETATTYFLVVPQEGSGGASSKEIASETVRPPVYPEMEPLNSGEIETTLREIYAEVINAMEGGSRAKTTSTEVAVTENKSNPATTSVSPDPLNLGSYHESGYQSKLSADSDHQELSENAETKSENVDSSTDTPLFSMGTPLTLNIFDKKYFQNSGKEVSLIAHTLTSEEPTSPIEKLTSSTTNVDEITTIQSVILSDLAGNQQNLPKLDLVISQETSSSEPPNTVDEKQIISCETPSISITERLKTEVPFVLEKIATTTTSSIRTSTDEPVEKVYSTVPVIISSTKESKPVVTDEVTVSGLSFIEDSSPSTTQSSVSSPKSLIPVQNEEPTNRNLAEDISSTTTQSSAAYSKVDTTHSDDRSHLTTTSKSISEKVFTQEIRNHSSPLPAELSSQAMSSFSSASTPKTANQAADTNTVRISTPEFSRNEDHTEDKTTPKNLPLSTTIGYHTSKPTDFSSFTTQDSSTITPSIAPTPRYHLEINSTSVPRATQNNEPAESKISDIQIEVYDSTLEPIVSATNFKHSTDVSSSTKHSNKDHHQERFTQYVVDRSSDFATQESSAVARTPGKPEPAAIEIHINVSEGFGNESEDLEFLYRQSDFRKFPSKKPPNSLKPFDVAPQNETSNEAAEEIVVEIIDGNSNSTENSASRENLNVNPVFTFRSDDDSQVELKNVKYYPEDRPPKDGPKSTDDFFVPHVGQQPSSANKPLMDRDSDTIFYISNTEVKVGESLPTTNTYDTQMKKSRLESQFFPANYEEHKKAAPQRYEEDIILSPPKNGPLKVIRRPLDISYVGESIMEVEQVTVTTTVPPSPVPGSTPDVIIEPAILPEMAIGVPVIGELPPQIELKEIDYMPNFDGNKEESSIQYGGDLIDEGGAMGVGFDMDSYPLGNLGMGNKNAAADADAAAISSQMLFNHRVNHLQKDVLSADLGGSSETADGNDLLRQTNDSVNGTAVGEKMGNATAYSVMEDRTALNDIMHFFTLRTLVFIGLYTLIPLVLGILLIYIWRDYNRKYKRNPFNAMGRNSSTDPLDAEKGNGGGDGDADGAETPEEDISRDTRVTKMHYNNSEKDGVFVVEVSRGADSKIMPGSPVSDGTEKRPFNIDADVKIVQSDTEALLSNHEKVQVHPPPPLENLINNGNSDENDTNHLHQIDEVDEFEECPRFTKNSNTGLSQSDLSSSSSVDSNKRYSYGNQELYTIEKQDYTTPSPTATKAPHPHAESKHPQPENHNDDNGHPENGHCLEKSPTPAPKCDSSITPQPPPPSTDKVHDMNGHHESAVESKPKITAALLKQDTVVVNEVTNGSSHDNGNENDQSQENGIDTDTGTGTQPKKANEATPQNPTMINMSSEPAADIKTHHVDYSANTENGFDSIISLPDPPSTEEIKQMNDIILMETNQLDSLPPPPPPATDNHQHHNGNSKSNGSAPFAGEDQNGVGNGDGDADSHSIVSSSESPMQTPTKVMKPLVPPTITVADTSALTTTATDIPVHSNGNCMTGHANTAIAVEVSGSS